MNFISREQVLALFEDEHVRGLRAQIERLPYFPAPNPNQEYDRNVMGQTEGQFWDAVDKQFHL